MSILKYLSPYLTSIYEIKSRTIIRTYPTLISAIRTYRRCDF